MSITIKQGVKAGLSFYQWKRKQNTEDWCFTDHQNKQLAYEIEQDAVALMQSLEATKKKDYLATDRNGWPEGGKSNKSLSIHSSPSEAAADGKRAFGFGNFLVMELVKFNRTHVAAFLQRKHAIKTKMENDMRLKLRKQTK